MKILGYGLLAFVLCVVADSAYAEPAEMRLDIVDHHFQPEDLALPAGQKIKLTIVNKDDSAAEFESFELSREKLVPAKGEVTVFVGPLDSGHYAFFDDFHRDTTKGSITVK